MYICNLALNFDNGFTGGREEPNAWLTDIRATWVADPPLAIVQSCKAPDSANTGFRKKSLFLSFWNTLFPWVDLSGLLQVNPI